jgi:acyl-CoA reductase-like NAD-dependent aldehyde dehydrogenase
VIASGNTCVVKPSELSPFSLLVLKNLISSYLHNECYTCIEGQLEVAKSLSTKKFDGICFTGSTEKGKLVAQAAA